MDAKKIAKTSGKVAGITVMGLLAGMTAVAQAQAEAQIQQQARRPFKSRYSDEYDTKTVVITSGEDTLSLQAYDDDHRFLIVDSTLKGCKPGRVVEIKKTQLAREINRSLQRNVYMTESTTAQAAYLYGSYEPLLFSRENKEGEMVPTFLDKGWEASLVVEAGV